MTLAELHVDLGNSAGGPEVFEAAARLRPRETRVWLAQARALDDLYELPRAARAYERVIELDPDQKEALVGLIRCWVLNNEPGRAEPWVGTGWAGHPDDPMILGRPCARLAFKTGPTKPSLGPTAHSNTIPEMPMPCMAYHARVALSQWTEALPDAERAAAAQPSDLESLQLLSMIETRMGLDECAAETSGDATRLRGGSN